MIPYDCMMKTYGKLCNNGINNTSNHSYEIECVPSILEIVLMKIRKQNINTDVYCISSFFCMCLDFSNKDARRYTFVYLLQWTKNELSLEHYLCTFILFHCHFMCRSFNESERDGYRVVSEMLLFYYSLSFFKVSFIFRLKTSVDMHCAKKLFTQLMPLLVHNEFSMTSL